MSWSRTLELYGYIFFFAIVIWSLMVVAWSSFFDNFNMFTGEFRIKEAPRKRVSDEDRIQFRKEFNDYIKEKDNG